MLTSSGTEGYRQLISRPVVVPADLRWALWDFQCVEGGHLWSVIQLSHVLALTTPGSNRYSRRQPVECGVEMPPIKPRVSHVFIIFRHTGLVEGPMMRMV